MNTRKYPYKAAKSQNTIKVMGSGKYYFTDTINIKKLENKLYKNKLNVADILNYVVENNMGLRDIPPNGELKCYYTNENDPKYTKHFLQKNDFVNNYSNISSFHVEFVEYEDRVLPPPFDNETLNQFRWGFTAATGLLIVLYVFFSTWNITYGILFLIILNYIPGILSVYLFKDDLSRSYPVRFLEITAIVTFMFIYINFSSILSNLIALHYIIYMVISVVLIILLSKLNETIRLHFGLTFTIGGFLTFFTMFIFNKFSDFQIIYFILFLSCILSYLLSHKIYEKAVLNQHSIFIDIFKRWFYKLRIIICIFIIYYFLFNNEQLSIGFMQLF